MITPANHSLATRLRNTAVIESLAGAVIGAVVGGYIGLNSPLAWKEHLVGSCEELVVIVCHLAALSVGAMLGSAVGCWLMLVLRKKGHAVAAAFCLVAFQLIVGLVMSAVMFAGMPLSPGIFMAAFYAWPLQLAGPLTARLVALKLSGETILE